MLRNLLSAIPFRVSQPNQRRQFRHFGGRTTRLHRNRFVETIRPLLVSTELSSRQSTDLDVDCLRLFAEDLCGGGNDARRISMKRSEAIWPSRANNESSEANLVRTPTSTPGVTLVMWTW